MSNKVRKTAKMTAQPKVERFIPTAEECARAIQFCVENDTDLRIWDRTLESILGPASSAQGNWRPLTQGEITKGNRFIAREAKRREYTERQLAIAERNARYREQLDRIAEAARLRAKAAEALKKMPAPILAKLP